MVLRFRGMSSVSMRTSGSKTIVQSFCKIEEIHSQNRYSLGIFCLLGNNYFIIDYVLPYFFPSSHALLKQFIFRRGFVATFLPFINLRPALHEQDSCATFLCKILLATLHDQAFFLTRKLQQQSCG